MVPALTPAPKASKHTSKSKANAVLNVPVCPFGKRWRARLAGAPCQGRTSRSSGPVAGKQRPSGSVVLKMLANYSTGARERKLFV
jgi:hypothetical protein